MQESNRRPEIFIGLISPVGGDLTLLRTVTAEVFEQFGYRAEHVRLSGLLHRLAVASEYRLADRCPEDERIRRHMRAGNALRQALQRGDALALLAVSEIRARREDNPDEPRAGTVYILESLKHPREVERLREIYGHHFVAISGFSPRSRRIDELAARIASSHRDSNVERHRSSAEALVSTDAEEVGNRYGQNVRETFALADLFVSVIDRKITRDDIERFADLLFGNPFITPRVDEHGMYMAKAASYRTSDMSRQVGAAVLSPDGEVVTLGCNEVSGPGGVPFWPERKAAAEVDPRDFAKGYDPNHRAKREILAELLHGLMSQGLLKRSSLSAEDLVDQLFVSPGVLKHVRANSLLEFGRIIHAEMDALTNAARRGLSVKHCVLYSTTFPCHICTRHIIASGIERVVYIEPYPKSMADRLYDDYLIVEESAPGGTKIGFQPFLGVAPRLFARLFEMRERKDSHGRVRNYQRGEAAPRLPVVPSIYLDGEKAALRFLAENETTLFGSRRG